MSTSPDTPPATPVAAPSTKEDTTVAILAYITIIGFIIAIVMHGNKKTVLGAYHLRQALGLFVTWMVLFMPLVIPFVNILWIFLSPLIGLAMFILLILGLISAVNGQQKPVPLVGEQYQKWFANAFN